MPKRVLKAIYAKIAANPFLKNVLLISGSTVIGQIIILCFYPIVSRIYSVSDFGIFQYAQSVISFLIIIASLRYELAILLPDTDKEAVNIWKLTLIINVLVFIVLICIIILIELTGLGSATVGSLGKYLYILPFTFLGAALYQGLVYLNLRFKNYKVIGKTKIFQAVGNSSAQLLFGVTRSGALGLFVGDLLGRSAGILNLVSSLSKDIRKNITKLEIKELKVLAKRYRNFPLFNSPGALLNTAGFALPALLFGKIYGLEILGLYALVDRVYAAPSALIGQSVSQVFMSEAASLAKTDTRLLKQKYIFLLKKLSLMFIIPTIIMVLLGPTLFSLVFGEKWRMAGEFASILATMQFAGFVVWPLIPTLLILEKQRIQLIWEGARVILIMVGFYICYSQNLNVIHAMIIYGSIMFLFYLLHVVISIYSLNRT